MAHQLSFNLRYEYNSRVDGITIETALYFGERSITVQAKIDPGRELCLFQREAADELEIDVESGYYTRVGTLTGSLPAYGHTVMLSTLGIEFESFVYFAADYGLPRNLLGREGWLQKVRLAIVDYDATLYLSPFDEANGG